MSAASNLSGKARKMLEPGDLAYALAVDDTSYPGQVLLAVARRAKFSVVIVMPAAHWDVLETVKLIKENLNA